MKSFENFECTQVNETEVDIRINGCLEWRLVLSNRMHDERRFDLARPGRDGFNLDYRWTTHFDLISRNIRQTITDAVRGHCAGAMGIGNNVEAIMEARRMLMKSNKQYLPRTRA